MKKWKLINELLDRLNGRNFHEFLTEDTPVELNIIGYAPHIGYRAWILEYKGVYMCFMSTDNGWWSFYSAVGYLDVLRARFGEWRCRVESKKKGF
jgi:hypothetical protein